MRARVLFMQSAAAWVLCAGASSAPAAEMSQQELTAARTVYVAKCAKCHKLHDPTGYTDSEWESWMAKMVKKARLKKDQTELLSRYLDTLRKPSAARR